MGVLPDFLFVVPAKAGIYPSFHFKIMVSHLHDYDNIGVDTRSREYDMVRWIASPPMVPRNDKRCHTSQKHSQNMNVPYINLNYFLYMA